MNFVHPVKFKVDISRLKEGEWRVVSDATLQKYVCEFIIDLRLRKSCLIASPKPWAELTDMDNLKLGVKQDEAILIMPLGWFHAGMFALKKSNPIVIKGKAPAANGPTMSKLKLLPTEPNSLSAEQLSATFRDSQISLMVLDGNHRMRSMFG